MALSTDTYTYDAVRLPSVDLTTTSEERVAGISSLTPPTVTSQVPQALIDLALRACGSAYENTDGLSLTPEIYASLGYSIPAAVAGALRLAGADA
jgi:hypothetical protein